LRIAVRYVSRSGNTKKVAEKIGAAIMAPAHPVSEPLEKPLDFLFIGGRAFKFGIDPALEEFIMSLSPGDAKKVAVFATCAAASPVRAIERLLAQRGIPVASSSFCCYGKFGFARKDRPSESDLRDAANFAKALVRHGFYL
jgi:flavodoxin